MLLSHTFHSTSIGAAFDAINYIPIFDWKELYDELWELEKSSQH